MAGPARFISDHVTLVPGPNSLATPIGHPLVLRTVSDEFSWRLHQAIPKDATTAILVDADLVRALSDDYELMEQHLPLHGIQVRRATLPDGTQQYEITRIDCHPWEMSLYMSKLTFSGKQ